METQRMMEADNLRSQLPLISNTGGDVECMHHIAALMAPRAASRFISAAFPLPRKYMYTCCK